jgi:hypothetical protein
MTRTLAWLSGCFALAACATVGGENQGSASGGGGVSYPEKPVFRMADIAGKEAAEIDALLGAPDLTRSEGEGEFRRYALAECALLIVLYPDERGVKRAATLDAGALKSGENKPDLDLCLARGKATAH